MRADIIDLITTRENYENFFDASPYLRATKKIKNGSEIIKKVINNLCEEIKESGYETRLSYGDTAIFIYKGEVPCNCW